MKPFSLKPLPAAAVLLIILASATCAFAREPISPAQFQKIQKFLDAVGFEETLPPPTAANLGFTGDAKQALKVVAITTGDKVVFFCRSKSNPNDLIVWVRGPKNQSSYMFSTHPDFQPLHALYLHVDAFPQVADLNAPEVRAVYDRALIALAKDADNSPLPQPRAPRH